MATPGEGRAVPSHCPNSSGYVNASMVAPNSSAETMFRYLMLSAYCGEDSAPDGDSVTVVRPFQAKPVLYTPVSSGRYRTPWSTPVSYSRSPTWSQVKGAIFVLSFRSIRYTRRDLSYRPYKID